jgi:hypothetical protein
VTLEELENTLPKGLHDAEVHKISVDYQEGTLTLHLAVWTGDMDDPPAQREATRTGRIELSGLVFLVMEPPDPEYPFKDTKRLTIDGGDMRKNLNSDLLGSVPDDVFVRSLWVNEWNAFIHVSAKNAQIRWLSDEILHRPPGGHIRPGETVDLT